MRAGKHRRHSAELPEPEILPLMNVLFMLVMVLLGMSAFLPIGVISTEAPKLSGGGGGGGAVQKEFELMINLLENEIQLSLDQASWKFAKIETKHGLGYDFEMLAAKLAEIKKSYPNEQRVMITAEEKIIYNDIIQTMDAARTTQDGKVLFPDVVFVPGIIND